LEGMSRAEIDALEEHERYRVVAMHDVSHVIPGARIRVTRPSGETIVTANAKGIYEVAGRVADDYTLELLDVPRTRRTVPYKVEKKELIQKRLFWLDLDIFWNGGIEGRVRDVSGGPVQALLDLRSTDGYLSGGTVRTEESGVFRVGALPPNRYILSISPYWPRDFSPYTLLYYPSSTSPEGARIFEIAEGQQIGHVDFAVRRLPKLKLQARVTWPDGQAEVDTEICIAYPPTDSLCSGTTDGNGVADVEVFGRSRIRAWAQKFVDAGPEGYWMHYGDEVELDTDKLPQRLDLVMSSRRRFFRKP
jgi:hypothetical protein